MRPSRPLRLLPLATSWLLAISSCVSLEPAASFACDRDSDCPATSRCQSGRCVSASGAMDSGTQDGGGADAGRPPEDGGLDGSTPFDGGAKDAGGPDASTSLDGGGKDGGPDAGSDAGRDGGVDAGLDAGFDGGVDASRDAGVDAGADAGADSRTDAGIDAGRDSGFSDAGSVCPNGNLYCNAVCLPPDGSANCGECGRSCSCSARGCAAAPVVAYVAEFIDGAPGSQIFFTSATGVRTVTGLAPYPAGPAELIVARPSNFGDSFATVIDAGVFRSIVRVTASGATPVASLPTAIGALDLDGSNEHLYYSRVGGAVGHLNLTTFVVDELTFPDDVAAVTVLSGFVYFSVDGVNGHKLWRSDRAANGTLQPATVVAQAVPPLHWMVGKDTTLYATTLEANARVVAISIADGGVREVLGAPAGRVRYLRIHQDHLLVVDRGQFDGGLVPNTGAIWSCPFDAGPCGRLQSGLTAPRGIDVVNSMLYWTSSSDAGTDAPGVYSAVYQ